MPHKYTIAVCNYNMAKTLEESLESMLFQIDNRFEVLVVDDGSSDNSLEVLGDLAKKRANLRYIALPRDKNRKLGLTRNISVRESKGEYVLLQLDADDKYDSGILDFVEVFHQIENHLGYDFYLKGQNINIGKKSFLLSFGPYRNLVGGEDWDMWRRLFAVRKIIWLVHKHFYHKIGYHKNWWTRFKRRFIVRTAEFQTGISFWSYLKWIMATIPIKSYWFWYELLICPITYLIAQGQEKYDTPSSMRKKDALYKQIEKEKMTLAEIEKKNSFKIDRTRLSQEGVRIFYGDI